MKKFLTTIIAAALLVSSAGCQVQQPQATQSTSEPASQALVLNVEGSTEARKSALDTSATLEKITAGLKIKVDTPEKKKGPQQANNSGQHNAPTAKEDKAQEPKENLDIQQSDPDTESKAATSTPAPKQPVTEPEAYLKVIVKATPTPPPAATPVPTPAPTPEPPIPTPEPPSPTPAPVEPTPEPVPSFDIDCWIGYAQSCAQGLGLRSITPSLSVSALNIWRGCFERHQ